MIAIIRIKGKVGIRKDIEETFARLRLRKKYTCTVVEKTPEIEGMLKKIKDFVSYGEIDEATYKELVEKRGRKDEKGKLKPFFRLHPARGGMDTKTAYPKGVLGENKEISKLIKRML